LAVLDGQQPAASTEEAGKPIVICVADDPRPLGRALGTRYTVLIATSQDEVLAHVEQTPDAAVVVAHRPEHVAKVIETRPQLRCTVVAQATAHEVIVQIVDQVVATVLLERDNARLLEELRYVKSERGKESEQLAQMGTQLDALTLRDPLTGLYTHRAFQERLREEVARAMRYSQPMSLLIADIDQFASVNYDLGYQAGDEILRKIAVILQEDESPDRVRSSDVVARYSGEEFVLLLPETAKPGALTKAARLRDAVAVTNMPGGRKLSLSIGVACLPEDAADPEGLLTAAEAALRGAKRGGPGRIHFFSSGDAGPAASRSRPFGRVREAEVDRFRPYQERMNEVTAIPNRDRSLAARAVDLARLHRVELDLGVAHHSEIYDAAAAVLDRLRGVVLDPADLICRSGDGNGYLVILAPRGAHRIDLEALSTSVERAVEEALAPMVSEVLREQPRITVGAARVLGNSLIRPERLTARLVHDAGENARNLRERKAHRDRTTLQDVILGEGLTSVYQPIVDLGTGDIFAFEALTRGPKTTALESPATLFAIADEVDLTVELDRACFRGALRNAMTLEPVHRLFVNLLPMSFYDSAFIEVEVGNLLSAAGLTPANIVFEITERLAIENFASFKRALASYTAMGFGVAIDDVGTRHSNLETVMSLRPHFIKISDVLVRGIARSTVKREMLRSLRHIAETIDAVMIAEGIEQVEDVVALRDLGIRYGQGYYMARPGPPFPTLPDYVRAELRNLNANAPQSSPKIATRAADEAEEEDDEDDRDLPINRAPAKSQGIPRNVFGRAEDEITNDFALPGLEGRRPRASEPPNEPTATPPATNVAPAEKPQPQVWQPLSDDEATGEALLSSLKRAENAPDGEPGPGGPGLN